MREYFRRQHDLNTVLNQQTTTAKPVPAVKPNVELDSGMGSSSYSLATKDRSAPLCLSFTVMASANEANPFLVEVTSIMKDIKSSIEIYVHAMMKAVVQYLGGVEVMSYLGHIFSTGLNFQMSMWQLVMMEAVYLPTIMREHLSWEMEMLRLFAKVIPILGPCSIPPPPFPVATQTSSAPKDTGGTSVSEPSIPSLPGDSQDPNKNKEPMTTQPIPATPSSGDVKPSTPLSGWQKLQSRASSKLLLCTTALVVGGQEGANKVVVHVTPS